jgi:hypothetical protein
VASEFPFRKPQGEPAVLGVVRAHLRHIARRSGPRLLAHPLDSQRNPFSSHCMPAPVDSPRRLQVRPTTPSQSSPAAPAPISATPASPSATGRFR